jgi:hypothetical protein
VVARATCPLHERLRVGDVAELHLIEKHRPADKPYVSQHPELAARAVAEARAGEDPRKASRWAVMCAKRRQFEPEHAEDLRISAIFIKYTVGSFKRESVQSINRDDVAICREIGGRDWIVTTD